MYKFMRWPLAGLLTVSFCIVTPTAVAEVGYPYYPSYFSPNQCMPDFGGPPNGNQFPNGIENGFGIELFQVNSFYGFPYNPEFDYINCSQLEPGSNTLTPWLQQIILSERLFQMSGIINNRLFGGRGGPGVLASASDSLSGRAAGDMLSNLSAWVSYGHTFADNDRPSTEFGARQHNVLAGVDYAFTDRLLAGLVFGYDSSSFDTAFNAGDMNMSGYTVAPYVAFMFTDNLSIDATAGYTSVDIRQTRTDPITQTSVSGDTGADRWFAASNLNVFHYWKDLVLSGRAGVVYAEDRQGSFTETGGPTAQSYGSQTSKFGQVQVGGEVAYAVHAIEPFASVYYQYDFKRERIILNPGQAQPSRDRDDFRISAGLRYFGSNGLSGILEYSTIAGRQDFDSHTLSLMLRMQF